MKLKPFLGTLLLVAALSAFWLAARQPNEPLVATNLTQPVLPAPTPSARTAAVFFSPLSPLSTPGSSRTVAPHPAATIALTGPSAAGRATRIIDGTPAPTATRGPSPTPPFTPTPIRTPHIEEVRLGSDLRITYLDDGQPFIYDLTDGSIRPAEPGADAQPAITPAPQTGPTSPDGRLIASQKEHDAEPVVVIRERAGLGRILQLPGALPVYWSPDNRYALAVVGRDPTQPTRLFLADLVQWRVFTLARGWQGRVTPIWAPGSRRLALEIRGGADAGLWLLDLANDWINPLAPGSTELAYDAIQWAADNELIARQVQIAADTAPQGRALLRLRSNGEYVSVLAGLAAGLTAGYRRLPGSTVYAFRHTYGMLLPLDTPTVSPTPAPTQAPTTDPIGIAAARLLKAPNQAFCPKYTTMMECATPLVTAILDFLAEHPGRPEAADLRDQIIRSRIWAFGYERQDAGDWLLADWLVDRVQRPFEQADGLPADFRTQWQPWGDLFETDLDGDKQPDYLLTARTGSLFECDYFGGLWWLRRQAAGYVLTPLPTTTNYDLDAGPSLCPDVRTIADLNGDGRLEVAYSVATCGPSNRMEWLRVLAWQGDHWRNLLRSDIWNPTNGEWQIRDEDGDGRAELLGRDFGPGRSFAIPLVAYARHFALHDGEWVPVRQQFVMAIGSEGAPYVTLGAGWLTHNQQFDDAARLLAPVAAQPKVNNPTRLELTPYALFRLGVLRVLQDDMPAAQAAWNRLLNDYPDHPIGRDLAQVRDLLGTRADWLAVCAWLTAHPSQWINPKDRENQSPSTFSYLDSRDVCDSRFLFELWTWPRSQPLADQVARFGQSWRLLSDQYDLNRDGVADPLGLVGAAGQPWAFISAGDVYHPLAIWSPAPLDTLPLTSREDLMYYFTDPPTYEPARVVTDLNTDGRPEILIIHSTGFNLWAWLGTRWQGNRVDYLRVTAGLQFTGQLTVQPAAERNSELQVALFADEKFSQAAGNQVYRWDGAELRLVRDAALRPPDPTAPLAEATEALFRRHQPEQARAALARYDPAAGVDPRIGLSVAWRTAMTRYLTALALDYAGRAEEARTLLAAIAQEYPDTGWAVLAKERRGQ